MKSRILVCGGRNFWNRELFSGAMKYAQQWFAKKYCIIEGDAEGADSLAKQWGRERGVPVLTVSANWTYYGNSAGAIRNTWMLDFAMPDLIIAFPGHIGTANMKKQAASRNVHVWEVK